MAGEFLNAVRNIHKFDHRYKKMHGVECVLQAGALGALFAGALCIIGGLFLQKVQGNKTYYDQIAQAQLCMSQQDYTGAESIVRELQKEDILRLTHMNWNWRSFITNSNIRNVSVKEKIF